MYIPVGPPDERRCRYSVETLLPSPLSALRSACQLRLAHFTRVGNSRTPDNTASLPRPSVLTASDVSDVSMRWTPSNSRSASAVVFPFKLSVIIEADAREMAHPDPW